MRAIPSYSVKCALASADSLFFLRAVLWHLGLLPRELLATDVRRLGPSWRILRLRGGLFEFVLDALSKCNRTSSHAAIDDSPIRFLRLCG